LLQLLVALGRTFFTAKMFWYGFIFTIGGICLKITVQASHSATFGEYISLTTITATYTVYTKEFGIFK